MAAMLHDLLNKILSLKAFAQKTAIMIGKDQKHRLNGAGLNQSDQIRLRKHAAQTRFLVHGDSLKPWLTVDFF